MTRLYLRLSITNCALWVAMVLAAASCSDSAAGPDTPPGGGWPTSTLAAQGLAEAPLLDLKRQIQNGELGAVHSLLVARNGYLVFEEYFAGQEQDDLHQVYSVTKSVAATLVGVAWDRGLVPDLDTPLLDLFPEYGMVKNPAGGKQHVTLRHALQMRTGFEWDEWATNYDDPTNPTSALFRSDDWMKFVLDLPMTDPPGTRFVYNSGVSMLLSGAIKNLTGERVADFADEVLFEPLGISRRHWFEGPNQIDNTGWGLHLRSRDMARIGQLYLQRGVWAGQRILSEAWIDESMERYTRFQSGWGYGYQWWLGPETVGVTAPTANGWGGQYIVIMPDLDAVVVSTAGNFEGGGLSPEVLMGVMRSAAAAEVDPG